MSTRSIQPGPKSLVALRWLSRLGASPSEPIALVMRWRQTVLHDHLARLAHAGLVRRIPMTRGHGSLIVVTPEGARMASSAGATAPRNVAPTSWAHTVACAWVAAWFETRGRDWLSSREIGHDDRWNGSVVYEDGYGRTQRITHRPDLVTCIGQPGRPVAIEVELQRKSAARMRGILGMYAQRTTEQGAELAGVVYITGSENVAKGIRTAAAAIELGEHPAGRLRLLTLEHVIAQARAAARDARAAARLTGASRGTGC
jgi:hypothetical protein